MALFLSSAIVGGCSESAALTAVGDETNGGVEALPLVNISGLLRGRWGVTLPGNGHSSPAVWGDLVVVTCAVPKKNQRIVLGLGAMDGNERWIFEDPFLPYDQHGSNSYASSTPAMDGERVCIAWRDGDTLVALALDHQGELLWRRNLGIIQTEHGAGSSPVLVDGCVVIANDNESEESALFGLDAATGEIRWRRERSASDTASYATPVPFTSANEESHVLFASTSHGLTCLKVSTGELVWEVDGLFSDRCVATPVICNGIALAFAGTLSGGTQSAAVALPGQPDAGQVRYKPRRALPFVPSPVAFDGIVFLFSDGGIISAIKAETGENLWRERVDGEFFGSPIAHDGKLYALSTSGNLLVLEATLEFHLLAEIELGERTFATPGLSSGVLYLRTWRHLIAVDLRQ